MSLHFSKKSKELIPKVSIKEKLESKDESDQALTKYKISLFARKFKNFMNFKRKITKKWKKNITKKEKEKASFKSNQVRYYNYGRKRHIAFDWPCLNRNEKVEQETWSDSKIKREEHDDCSESNEHSNFVIFPSYVKVTKS